jgi:hypothetical protein
MLISQCLKINGEISLKLKTRYIFHKNKGRFSGYLIKIVSFCHFFSS